MVAIQLFAPGCFSSNSAKFIYIGEPAVFLGDGVPVFLSVIEEHVKVPYSFAPAHANRQRAGAVAALGALLYGEGKIQQSFDHSPEYLRLSQAERERMEKMHGGD